MVKKTRTNLHARVEGETPEGLKNLAFTLGYTYGGEGSIGKMLDAIANGEILIVPKRTSKSG